MDSQYMFAVATVGDSGCGKTAIMKRFEKGEFDSSSSPTVGVDFFVKCLDIDGVNIKFQIWDTAGQERYRAIVQTYYRNVDALLIVYDVCNIASFQSLQSWINDATQYSGPETEFFLVGNKVDDEKNRVISSQKGEAFAREHGMSLIETSAVNGYNVEELFKSVARRLLEKNKRSLDRTKSVKLSSSVPYRSKNECCS